MLWNSREDTLCTLQVRVLNLKATLEIFDQPVDQVYIELLNIIRSRQNDEIFISTEQVFNLMLDWSKYHWDICSEWATLSIRLLISRRKWNWRRSRIILFIVWNLIIEKPMMIKFLNLTNLRVSRKKGIVRIKIKKVTKNLVRKCIIWSCKKYKHWVRRWIQSTTRW